MSMSNKNQQGNEDHTWQTHMRTLWRRKMVIEIEEMLPEIIDEWYREQGLETPNWKQNKPYFDEDGNIIRPEED